MTIRNKKKISKKQPKVVEVDSDEDEEEKIDADELTNILQQFDKANDAFAGRAQVAEEVVEESIELTDESVPENDADLTITSNKKSKTLKAPNVHYFIHLKKRFLKIQISLHKIPEKFMKLNLEKESFSIDTTGYSKKLFLERKYPGLVKVDPTNSKAELQKGDILTVWVPILSMPKITYDKELVIVQGRVKEKTIKFQPEVKKIIAVRAKLAAKKSAHKKRKRDTEKFYEQGKDIKKNSKKQKTA